MSREVAQAQLSPMQMSFMSESRRLRNQRMKRELRLVLRYPQVLDGLREALSACRCGFRQKWLEPRAASSANTVGWLALAL